MRACFLLMYNFRKIVIFRSLSLSIVSHPLFSVVLTFNRFRWPCTGISWFWEISICLCFCYAFVEILLVTLSHENVWTGNNKHRLLFFRLLPMQLQCFSISIINSYAVMPASGKPSRTVKAGLGVQQAGPVAEGVLWW